ncbi:glycogen debranching protein [Sulfurifustis variabilis]|uniref:Glycogen debranching protein n=1 Tax=Sulfurifustis variabilis TaxID=1675686 RepID=A0A1B4V6S8_9GAMM|nr:amylo-alpha-1,6-glucosidase [Sulfurifustis variabilis]BAU48292.1 glycogen debranching protein [Sulfurifustis variabilis]
MSDAPHVFRRPDSGWKAEDLLSREWLVTNGLGGYASGTIAGVHTRAYHGFLTAALPAPLGRLLMLKQLSEQVRAGDDAHPLIDQAAIFGGKGALPEPAHLKEFRLETGLPVWRFDTPVATLERRVCMPHGQNTVYVAYRVIDADGPVRLTVRPWIHFRSTDNPSRPDPARGYSLRVFDNRYEINAEPDFPALRLLLRGDDPRFVVDGGMRREVYLAIEAERGYEPRRMLWSPGWFAIDLARGQEAALIASSEPWNAMSALSPDEAHRYEQDRRRRLLELADARVRSSPVASLVLAADQFLVAPAGRVRDAIRANAEGDQVRSVIAGYHWFGDWGRDTMISLEGLTLVTGRHTEAGWILRTFQHYVRDGLIPNMFPEGEEEGLYHTADATLWFFQALDRYLAHTDDRGTLRRLLPTLVDIVGQHLAGTRFGIGVDRNDGLLRQGAEGYQLTWMDAKVEDWVVTPRRGKAVEINALWYNALRLLAGWLRDEARTEEAAALEEHAARARRAFNARFWYAQGGYLYDVVDGERGDDTACRPNQLFAFTLRHPVLARERWAPVLDVVRERLLTPVGLRSLAPDQPGYKARYFGDLRARDAAYHQGTVWAWLIGPFVDAWLAVRPDDRDGARRCLEGLLPHLDDACIGSISEIFDAEEPYAPRGCVSQAWSVAEMLRAWVRTQT